MLDACYSAEVPNYLQDRNHAIISLLYDTGLRRGEAAALDVEQVRLDEDTPNVYLPSSIQKGNPPPATLDLGKWGADSTTSLRRYLNRRWKDTDALFPSRSSDRMAPRSINRVVKRAAALAAVEPQTVSGTSGVPGDVSAHTLRHSVAYRIIKVEGGRLEDVQLRLRHSNRATTDRIYSHLRSR